MDRIAFIVLHMTEIIGPFKLKLQFISTTYIHHANNHTSHTQAHSLYTNSQYTHHIIHLKKSFGML